MSRAASIGEREGGGRLTIDLAAIAANWRMLQAWPPASECGAAVKADAYGTGIDVDRPDAGGRGLPDLSSWRS